MSTESSPVKHSKSINNIQALEDFENQDTLIKHVDITIVESEKRANGTLHVRDHYTVYLIDVKELGVVFTSDLSFHQHICEISNSAYKQLGFVIRNSHELLDKATQTLYIALVQSILKSNSVVWCPYEQKYVQMLERVQMKFLRVTDPEYKQLQSKISTIWRRYTEFEQIHDYLQVTYPHVVIPPVPEKRINYAWRKSDTTDPEFIERRRAGLENFLLRVASHPQLCFDDQFINFLQQEHGWRETITDSGYLLQAENKLKSLSVSIRLKKPDPEIDGVKNYGKQLETNLGNFLYTRSKIIEKNYALCKLHANYGKLFSEWSVIEKEMGDGLQKAGHYFDSIADSIESIAEDEEQLADQLKEYLFYAAALQHLCANHEALQRNLEYANDALTNRIAERNRAAAGKSGIMSRLFGTTEPDIVRDQSTRLLDAKILADTHAIERARADLEEFSKKASVEIEYFQKQKDKDLHESLVNLIALQVKAAKKNLQAWTQIKECLQNMP